MRKKRNVCRLLVGNPAGKTALERPRRRWKRNIKMDLLEIRLVAVDRNVLAQNGNRWRAVVSAVMKIRVP
jgi:hypothetical protein